MLLVASIICAGLQCVLGSPQLRLSHTGYEIISFNDQTPDESQPAATKLTLQNASRYNGPNPLNLEKAEPADDEAAEGTFLPPSQQHKRHYDFQRSSSDSKWTSELRRNAIDTSSKISTAPSEKTNVYLAVGIPSRFENPANRQKESTSGFFSSSEATNSNVDSKNPFEDPRREIMTSPKIDDKKIKGIAKFGKMTKNQGNERIPAIFDADFDSAEPKEDAKLEKFTALVADAHRALDDAKFRDTDDAKSESEEKIETKAAFPTVGKVPSIQIHRQRSFYLPSRSSALFSPIYPSGLDTVADNFVKKSANPANDPSSGRTRNFQSRLKNSAKIRKYVDADIDVSNKFSGHEINEISGGNKKIADTRRKDKIQSIPVLKDFLSFLKHDIFNSPRNSNGIPLITGLHPVIRTSLWAPSIPMTIQPFLRGMRPPETHLELNSMPLVTSHVEHHHPTTDLSISHSPGRLEDTISGSLIDASRTQQSYNELDGKHLESRINRRITKPESRADFFKNYLGKMSNRNVQPTVRSVVLNQPAKDLLSPTAGSLKGNLVIDIVHESSADSPDEDIDKSEKSHEEVHDPQYKSHTPSSAPSTMICKRMKPTAPPFYQFLAKFGDIVLDNALKYEKSLQVRDSAEKLIEAVKK